MLCMDCGTSVIGSIPDHLYNARRCPKCYRIYTEQLEKKEDKQEVEQETKQEPDEPIDNRFDILDM